MNAVAQALERALPGVAMALGVADRIAYGYDNSRIEALPAAVVFPASAQEVQALVRLCKAECWPIVVRGRGTNTTGATVPLESAIVMSTEGLNRVIEIRPEDRLARVEPGVINGDLDALLAPRGLMWPPDPTSAGYSTIGGNLGCNAAGPRAVKYGSCRENTLGLTVIDGHGELLKVGVETTKGVVGYDLTRLFIGSEGTLGIIVEATLKLSPRPTATATLSASFASVAAAARAVSALMAQPVVPAAVEFLDSEALRLARAREPAHVPDAQALLLIEVDGDETRLAADLTAIRTAVEVTGLIDVRQAFDAKARTALWAARKALSPALRAIAPNKINEDVVVPVSRLALLVDRLGDLARQHRIPIVNFGHAGNGNLHVNLLIDALDKAEAERAQACLDQVFATVLELGGTLSGEHGTGLVKRAYVGRELSAAVLARSRQLKALFDPAGILNPGKFLPD